MNKLKVPQERTNGVTLEDLHAPLLPPVKSFASPPNNQLQDDDYDYDDGQSSSDESNNNKNSSIS